MWQWKSIPSVTERLIPKDVRTVDKERRKRDIKFHDYFVFYRQCNWKQNKRQTIIASKQNSVRGLLLFTKCLVGLFPQSIKYAKQFQHQQSVRMTQLHSVFTVSLIPYLLIATNSTATDNTDIFRGETLSVLIGNSFYPTFNQC